MRTSVETSPFFFCFVAWLPWFQESSGESEEYNPAEDDVSAEEDHTIDSEDEDEEEGRTSSKRPRLDPEPQQQSSDSDV